LIKEETDEEGARG